MRPHAEANATLVEPSTADAVEGGRASRVIFMPPGGLIVERFAFRMDIVPRSAGRRSG
jgi:hypothetical protein